MATDPLLLKVEAQVAEALAGINAVKGSVVGLHEATVKSAAGHTAAAAASGLHLASLKALGEGAATVGEKFKSLVETTTRALLRPGTLIGGALGVGAAVEAMNATMAYHQQLALLTIEFNNDATAASTWNAVANMTGVSSATLSVAMKKLSTDVNMDSKGLRDMGIATVDTNGNLLSMNTVLQEAQGWFQAHAGSSLAAAKAVELFGIGGQELLPILESDKKTMADMTEEAKRLGLVMDNETLAKTRAMEFEVRRGEESLKAMGLTIMTSLLPGLAALANALANWVTANIGKVKQAITELVSFIVGFFQGILPGFKFGISDVAQEVGNLSDAVSNAGSASDSLAASNLAAKDAQQALADQTKDTVDALNAQIAAIQDLTNEESYMNRLNDLHQQGADKQREIDKLTTEYHNDLLLGDLQSASTVYDQLTKAKEEADKIQRTTTEENTKHTRDAQMESLRQQIKAVQDAAAAQQAAMAASAAGIEGRIAAAGTNIVGSVNTAALNIVDSLDKGGTEAGEKFASSLKSAVGDITTLLDPTADPTKKAKALAGFDSLAREAGKAFTDGMWSQIQYGFMHPPKGDIGGELEATLGPLGPLVMHQLFGNSTFGSIFGFAEGGQVPGPVGQPQVAVVHGGETVRNREQEARLHAALSGSGSRGDVTIENINVTAPFNGTPDDLARAIRREMAMALGRR